MEPRATLVADLGFGDAGKGSIVDYLVREESVNPVVVRYNGGPQAAHNVMTEDGLHHTFAHFGSGSLVPRVRTYLSRHMLVNPFNAFSEADELINKGVTDIWLRTTFDEEAVVITPFHIAANQLREIARGGNRHGSCGQGIGETRWLDIRRPELTIRVKDFFDINGLFKKILFVQSALRDDTEEIWTSVNQDEEARRLVNLLRDPTVIGDVYRGYRQFVQVAHIADSSFFEQLSQAHDHLIFEGAQGVLLDEKYGFHPHTTWSNITYENAFDLLDEVSYDGEIVRLGLIRGYAVRHGAGPFVSEDAKLSRTLSDYHNTDNPWQQSFRVGYADTVATRYGIEAVGGVDELGVTNLDRMIGSTKWSLVNRYQIEEPANPDALFERDESGHVKNIRFKKKKDLVRQEAITNVLMQARPVLQAIKTTSGRRVMIGEFDISMYLDQLSEELAVPITLASSSPTAAGKQRLALVQK